MQSISGFVMLFLINTLLLYPSLSPLINTLLLYPSLSPHGRTDGETNTLASHGLEEPFFQLCCCVSFWFWREIGFGCTYYYVLGVPYSCGVVLVFWFWREIVFGVTYILSLQYSCAVVSFFLLWWES